MEGNLPKYKMRATLSAIEGFGENLYQTTPSVISEIVANAWDADAENVNITIDAGNRVITIADDGHGMSFEDLNQKFLVVGRDRRKQEGTGKSPGGRDVMGRKGIGKLSLLAIANIVEIHTMKDGIASGFIINNTLLKNSVDDTGEYEPQPILGEQIDIASDGTKVIIRELSKDLKATKKYFKSNLAKRLPVAFRKDVNFSIIVNGDKILLEDMELFEKLQYIWFIGEDGKSVINNISDKKLRSKLLKCGSLIPETSGKIHGWVGSFHKLGEASDSNGETFNQIAVIVRGKVAASDIRSKAAGSGHYQSYITGQIYADFLDDDGKKDISVTSREGFKENDPRFKELIDIVKGCLIKVNKEWSRNRKDAKTKKESSKTTIKPDIKARLEALDLETQEEARELLERTDLMYSNSKGATKARMGVMSFFEDASKKLASRGIERNEEIYALMEQAGLLSLKQLYNSLSTISLKQHASVGYIIAWVFIENLAVVAKGDKDSTSRKAFSGSGDAIIKYLSSNDFDKDGVSYNILTGFKAKSNSIKHENRLSSNALDLRGDFKKLEPMLLNALGQIQK